MRRHVSQQSFLLLGGEGFVGRNIASYLSERNRCVSVGDEQSLFEKRQDTFCLANPYAVPLDQRSDVVIHLIDHKVGEDIFLEQEKKLVANIGLDANQHLILLSSAVVYVNASSEYGRRKQMLEQFYTTYCRKNGIKLTILRLFNTFGPYQVPYRQGSLVGNLIYHFLSHQESVINEKEATRDFVYAGDIPQFIEYVIAHKIVGIHDIGSGRLISLEALIMLLSTRVLKSVLDISYRGLSESIPSRCAAGLLVDKIPVKDLEQGLNETVDFYRDNMSVLERYVK